MAGGALILAGIFLKITGVTGPWAAIAFGVGGTLKLLYMILGVRSGLVKLGPELILLVVGLSMIFAAVYFRKAEVYLALYGWFLAFGIVLKTLFVLLFIRRQKKYRKSLA